MDFPELINIYSIKSTEGEKLYFFSVKKKDNLSFSYYMLSNKEGTPKLKKINRTLDFLQNSKIKLRIVKENTDEYEEFLSLLYTSMYGPEEKTQTSSKRLKRK